MTNQPSVAAADLDDAGVRKAWIFCPEEPETYVYVAGRMLQFVNGRIAAHLVGLTDDGLDWFRQRPEYIVYVGSLNAPEAFPVYRQLMERVMRMAGRKADASDIVKVTDQANFLLSVMMSEKTVNQNQPPAAVVAAGLGVIERQMPSVAANPLFRAAMAAAEGQAADDAAIARGLSGVTDMDQLEVEELRARDAATTAAPVEMPPPNPTPFS